MSLLVVKTPEQVTNEEKEAIRKETLAQSQAKPLISGLAGHVTSRWEEARRLKEMGAAPRLEDCARRRSGQYSPAKLEQIKKFGGSTIFMNLTNVKCRAIESWLLDILCPVGDKPWGIKPSPIADIPPQIADAINSEIMAEAQKMTQQFQGVAPDAAIIERARHLQEKAKNLIQKEAKERAVGMERTVADQLSDGEWDSAFADFLYDVTTYPTAILKAPVMKAKRSLVWKMAANEETGQQSWEPIVERTIKPEVARCSPFDIFPGAGVVKPDDGDIFEIHRLTRRDLEELIGVDGYDEDAVRSVLSEYGSGGLKSWLWTVTDERDAVDPDKVSSTEKNTESTIDALEMWGSVQGKMLVEWGLEEEDIPDQEAEYDVCVWMIGRYVIKAVLNPDPLGKKPYHIASYEPIPGSFWGKAPCEVIADPQDMCNACARSLDNNMGIASGPQVEANVDRVADVDDIYDIYPWKVWPVTNDMTSTAGGAPAIRFFNPESIAGTLLQVFQYFSKLADDYLAIPSFAYGSSMNLGGAGRTSSGLNMLMGNATKGIKNLISNIDTVIQGVISGFCQFNMMYSDDEAIKGDLKPVATGSSEMLARHQQKEVRMGLLQASANPVDIQIFGPKGRAKLWAEILKSSDIDPAEYLPTPDKLTEIEEKMRMLANSQNSVDGWQLPQQQQGQQPQQQPQQQAQQAQPQQQGVAA
ncbi:MAG: hypothetical protein WCS15_00255 [Prevotella sp.]|nr:hypothetical protein [Massilibacteroides sp.]